MGAGHAKAAKDKFDPWELAMLNVMFDELVDHSESPHGTTRPLHVKVIDKKAFLQFFPLPGLLGERLFSQFDSKHVNHIEYEEFLSSFAVLCRGGPEEKVEFLFHMFDLGGDDLVSREELSMMLGSSLASMTQYSETPVPEFNTVDVGGDNKSSPGRGRSGKGASPIVTFANAISKVPTMSLEGLDGEGRRLSPVPTLGCDLPDKDGAIKSEGALITQAALRLSRGYSEFTEDIHKTRGPLNERSPKLDCVNSIISNNQCVDREFRINAVVKKIVDDAFENCDINHRGQLNLEEFRVWCRSNSTMFEIFEEAFDHIGIALENSPSVSRRLNFPKEKPRDPSPSSCGAHNPTLNVHFVKRGYLFKIGRKMGGWARRYFGLANNFLFAYSDGCKFEPQWCIFLESCSIFKIVHDGKPGFRITYCGKEKRSLYADTEAERDAWYDALSESTHYLPIEATYILGEHLGTGRFSTVRKGTSRTTGDCVAIKVVEKVKLHPDEWNEIQTEVAALRILHHPNVVKLLDVFDTPSTFYIVMEWIQGGELFDRIVANKGGFSEDVAKKLAVDIISGVSYVHRLGLIHRDIKPENLLFLTDNPDSPLKIADFGFSRFLLPGEKLDLAVGTPFYMAPEVIKKTGYGKAVDLWSLGVILFVLLSGRMPFKGENMAKTFQLVLKSEPKMDTQYWANVSEAAKDVVRALLVPDPDSRATIEQLEKMDWFKGCVFNDTGVFPADMAFAEKNAPRTITPPLRRGSSSEAPLSRESSGN